MALLLLLSSLPVFLLLLLQKYRRSRSSIRWPPGPQSLPLIGNLHQFDSSNPPLYFQKLSAKYGPIVSFRLGFVPTLIVSSSKLAKEIFKTHDLEFCSRPTTLGRQTLSYNGLDLAFTAHGDYWREIRKICVLHLFSPSRVQQFRPIRENEVYRMIKYISILSSAGVASFKPINLGEIMVSLTSTVTCRLAFGKRYEDECIERRFHALLKEAEVMLVGFFFSDHFPFMGWVDKLTGMSRRLQKVFKELDKFYEELIEEHLDPKRPKSDEKKDIIDVLLQIQKDHEIRVGVTHNHIKAILMDVFVAGSDKSAAATIWAMTHLMKSPRVMKKVQDEIRCTIGNKGFVNEDDIQGLPYFQAVVKETMRLQPPNQLIPRETTEKCILDGYEIPAKTSVFINVLAIGRDHKVWDNPEEFYPDRFIGSCIDLHGQNFELIPFGGGRRICPGMYLGLSIMELALANLLYKFDWEMPDGMNEEDLDFEVQTVLMLNTQKLPTQEQQDKSQKKLLQAYQRNTILRNQ